MKTNKQWMARLALAVVAVLAVGASSHVLARTLVVYNQNHTSTAWDGKNCTEGKCKTFDLPASQNVTEDFTISGSSAILSADFVQESSGTAKASCSQSYNAKTATNADVNVEYSSGVFHCNIYVY